MTPGYQGPLDESIHELHNRRSALSGDENLGELFEETTEDKILAHNIREKLQAHVEVDSSHVKVAVKEGFVSLTGIVYSQESLETIKTLVENMEGVQDVACFLEIDNSDSGQMDLRL